MERWVWFAVLVVNVVTFLVYGFDKLCAVRRWRRVREAHLLWLAFLCGFVGAWMGVSIFRHKTGKVPFRRWLIALTLLNPFWVLVYQALR